MNPNTSFTRITTDTGIASEFLHVSPILFRSGPRTRGAFADRRLTRARRTEARHSRRSESQPEFSGLSYFDRVQGW